MIHDLSAKAGAPRSSSTAATSTTWRLLVTFWRDHWPQSLMINAWASNIKGMEETGYVECGPLGYFLPLQLLSVEVTLPAACQLSPPKAWRSTNVAASKGLGKTPPLKVLAVHQDFKAPNPTINSRSKALFLQISRRCLRHPKPHAGDMRLNTLTQLQHFRHRHGLHSQPGS